MELLKYLDVETYELVGESVIQALLKAGVVRLNEVDSIQKYIISCSNDARAGEIEIFFPQSSSCLFFFL